MPQPFVVQPREPAMQRVAGSGRRAALRRVAPDTADQERHHGAAETRRAQTPTSGAPAPGGWRPTRGQRTELPTDPGVAGMPSGSVGAPGHASAQPVAARAVPRHPVLEPLAPFLDDPAVTDIFINGAAGLFVDRGAGAVAVPRWRAAESDVRDLAVALIGLGGRHIDESIPN